jgi:hypothetical protein
VRAVSSEYRASDWSARQALGAPDVYPKSGDAPKAWASKEPDAASEHLEVGFAPTRTKQIRIYETFNPGAIASVDAILASGKHERVLEVAAPAAVRDAARIVTIDLPCTAEPVVAVRVTLASAKVPGWNEIDAIGLVPCK